MGRSTKDEVYAYIRDKILSGVPPTVRDVQHAMGFQSAASAREHIDKLVTEGRLIKEPGLSRGLRLPSLAGSRRPLVQIPILGRVRAGEPTLTNEEPQGYLAVQTFFPLRNLFALRVQGDSMVGVGIFPNDLVVVHRQPDADSGQVVVALVGEDEATVKVLRRRRARVELHPANPDYPIIVPTPKQPITILGLVIEVRRYLIPNA